MLCPKRCCCVFPSVPALQATLREEEVEWSRLIVERWRQDKVRRGQKQAGLRWGTACWASGGICPGRKALPTLFFVVTQTAPSATAGQTPLQDSAEAEVRRLKAELDRAQAELTALRQAGDAASSTRLPQKRRAEGEAVGGAPAAKRGAAQGRSGRAAAAEAGGAGRPPALAGGPAIRSSGREASPLQQRVLELRGDLQASELRLKRVRDAALAESAVPHGCIAVDAARLSASSRNEARIFLCVAAG